VSERIYRKAKLLRQYFIRTIRIASVQFRSQSSQ